MENTKKQFLDWIKVKIKLNNSQRKTFFKERDVYWASFGKNIGSEQDGKNENFTRPVLVLKRFNSETFLSVPTSTKVKNDKFHYFLRGRENIYFIKLSQLRLLSSKRLLKKIERISIEDFEKIKEKIKKVIF